MKVIHILNSLKFSGAEIMYVAAAPLFQQKGCELTVVATAAELGEYAPYFENAGYKVLHKPYPPMKKYLKRLKYYWQFSRLLKREKMDVVHIHSHKCMWGISFAAWLAKKTAVYTFHNVFTSKTITYPFHYLRRWTAKNIFGCTFQTISDSVYEHELHFWHNKTTKVYNWYDSNRFYPASQEEKNELRTVYPHIACNSEIICNFAAKLNVIRNAEKTSIHKQRTVGICSRTANAVRLPENRCSFGNVFRAIYFRESSCSKYYARCSFSKRS
jgi:hypothetical protein